MLDNALLTSPVLHCLFFHLDDCLQMTNGSCFLYPGAGRVSLTNMAAPGAFGAMVSVPVVADCGRLLVTACVCVWYAE